MGPNMNSWDTVDPSSFHCLIDVSEEIELLRKNVHDLAVHSRLTMKLTESMLIEDLVDMVIFQINMIPSMPFHPMQTAGLYDQGIFPINFREDMKEAINEEFLSTLEVQQYFSPNPDDHTQISMYCLLFLDHVLDRIEMTLRPLLHHYPLMRQFYHIELVRKMNGTMMTHNGKGLVVSPKGRGSTLHLHFHWPPVGDSRENPFER